MAEAVDHLYAEAVRSERWIVDGEARRVESVGGSGWSEATAKRGGVTYTVRDLFEGTRRAIGEQLRERLNAQDEMNFDALRATKRRLEIRRVARVRYVERDGASETDDRIIVTISTERAAIVTQPPNLENDLATLLRASPERVSDESFDARAIPLVWTGGSGAVLLHEAVGHPSEQSVPRIDWPPWLEVLDDPGAGGGLGTMRVDDAARAVARVDLLRESPGALRRESFRDIPLRRMTNLVVVASAEAPLPDPRIEIALVAGGSYDALTDTASLSIAAAAFIDGTMRRPLPPFDLRADRRLLAAKLLGASGTPRRYPGVICFDEGQRMPVGSFAPDLVMAPLEDR